MGKCKRMSDRAREGGGGGGGGRCLLDEHEHNVSGDPQPSRYRDTHRSISQLVVDSQRCEEGWLQAVSRLGAVRWLASN